MSRLRQSLLSQPVLLELGPAVVFLIVNFAWSFRAATAAVMLATLAAVAVGWFTARKVPLVALATLCIVLGLGAAGLLFDDERFIKMKPTIGRGLFALALLVGLAFRPSFLERVFANQLQLTRRGWRVLTAGWIALALSLALLNEIVWRSLSTDRWVAFDSVVGPASILGYIAITHLVAKRWWHRGAETNGENSEA